MVYAVAYTAHFIFDTLYDAGPIWSVFNIISAVGILLALVVNFVHLRQATPYILEQIGSYTLFYANAILAVWFFRNWIHLLALAEGESVNVYTNVLWMLIAGLIPLVLAATGWRLWSRVDWRGPR